MNIGIIGAGNVGGSLGKALTAKGHAVQFGVRDPAAAKVKALLAACGPNASAGSVAAAVAFGAVVAVALPWDAMATVIPNAGDWNGKVVIDATNRFGALDAASQQSSTADLAEMVAGAAVVKAFNTIGAEHYVDPVFEGRAAMMPVCGDDADAKTLVIGLVNELGFEAVDAGGLAAAPMLQSLTMLWVSLARSGMGRDFAFGLLRK